MNGRIELRAALTTVMLLAGACVGSGGSSGTGSGGRGGGGVLGTGGANTSSGGITGSGGATGSGGTTGSGGAPGSGGATGSGGAPGSGGVTGSGGATASGGAGGTGGNSGAGGSASGTTGGAGGNGGATSNGGAGGRAGGAGAGGRGGSLGSGGVSGAGGAGGAGGGGDLSIAAQLNSSAGFKMQAPCGTPASTLRSCDHNPRSNCGSGLLTFMRTDKMLGGSKGTFYDVTLHFRGILEANQYSGGTSDHDGFYTGGQVSNASGMDGGAQYNQYVLELSSPKATYHLNHIDQNQRDMYRMGLAGSSGLHHFGFIIDYHKTIRVEGGATVSLYMLDNDCLFGRNCKPPADDVGHCDLQTLPNLPGIPQPFDGNFIWVDVEGVTAAP